VRDACGWDRLGPHVNKRLSEELSDAGLGHLPADVDELPLRANQQVWIYAADSKVGRVIKTVLNPTPKQMRILKKLANEDGTKKLRDIRAILNGDGDG